MPYLPLLLFAALYAGATLACGLPALVGAGYLAASLACFGVYARDKAAARGGRRRTSERTLLVLGLLGGWPGAVLAQQWLRHKTVKRPFQTLFQLSMALNIGLFAWLSWRLRGA